MRLLRAALIVVAVAALQSCTVKQTQTPDLLGPTNVTAPAATAPPTAQFVFSPASPALGSPVAFDGRGSCPEAGFNGGCVLSDRSITAYSWDFGDGGVASGASASHAFRTLGSFNVTLTVVNDKGLSSTGSRSVTVGAGGIPPQASFVFSPTNPTIGQSTSFNAAPSRGGSNSIANYSWDFGDGGKGSGINPSHAFGNAGSYIVLLIVTDEAGQTSTATQSVPVQALPTTPLPTADFVFSPTGPTIGQSVSFNATTSKPAIGHSITGYSWNFGDGGTASGATPNHTYNLAGTYSVVLAITDDLGQTATASKTVSVTSTSTTPPPTADFVFSPTNPIVAQSVSFNASLSKAATGHSISSYSWDFGDASPAGTGVTPSHAFANAGTFSVVLTVTDDLSQTTTVAKTVTVTTTPSNPPTADFVFSPGSPQVNTVVLFDATASTAPQGHSLTYAWNFGDAATGTTVTPSHTYTAANSYNVVLKVTDTTTLLTATVTKTVVVSSSGTQPPTADFVFSPGSPQVNTSVLFDATASTVAQGHSLSYAWNFGDSATGTGVTPSHTYTTANTFSVVLKVTDTTTQQTATVSKTVGVSSTGSTPPTADFVFSPAQPQTNSSVLFDATASTVAQGHALSYAWNFGDNLTGTGVTTNHSYTAANTYSVVLKVTDTTTQQTATVSKSVPVSATTVPPPNASFVFSPTSPAVGDTVAFDARNSSAATGHSITQYKWTFGDNSAPVISNTPLGTTHIYSASSGAGTYAVVLVVTDDVNGTSTTSQNITVGNPPAPTAKFTFSPVTPVVGDSVTFDAGGTTVGQGVSISKYDWNFGDGTPITTCHVPAQGGDAAACTGGANRTISHTFTSAAAYTVNLVVTDNATPVGRTGSTSAVITVATPNPTARLTLTKTQGFGVLADASASTATGNATIINYAFNWGDGSQTQQGSTPILPHTFPGFGTYTVVVTVTDSRQPVGFSNTTSATITYQP